MGHGIALACLRNPETQVTLISRSQESLDHGSALIRSGPYGIERSVERNKITREQADEMLDRLRTTLDFEGGLVEADLVFESVPEILDLKKQILAEAEKAVPASTVFASGTSAIMIAELGSALESPGRLVGTHWFYPANIMPLVEVARSDMSHDDVVERVLDFLRSIEKKPVMVNDAPGFFMTRFINLYIAEAIRLVELGVAGIVEIDAMVKTGLGWPMGVFELLDDTASFDSWYHAQEYLHETCGERYAIPPLARKVFSAGYRGDPSLKPGSRGGWYQYFGIPRSDDKKRR